MKSYEFQGLNSAYFPPERARLGQAQRRRAWGLALPQPQSTKGGPAMLLTPSRFLTELSPDLYQPLKIKRSYGW